MIEIWKEIPNREGYLASNLGRIKSTLTSSDGKILSFRKDKDGYLMVWTKYNGADRVHRLITVTFIDNVENKPIVNHINGIVDDNRVDNLEWASVQENTKHAYDIGLSFSSKSENIAVYYKDNLLSIFESISKLSKYSGIDRNTISYSIKDNSYIFDELQVKKLNTNERLNTHEFYEREFIKVKLKRYQSEPLLYNNEYFESIKELSENYNYSRGSISYAIRKGKLLKGLPIKKISRYEYISQNGFND